MPFESGTFALMPFRLQEKLPDDIFERLSKKVAPKIDDTTDQLSIGWVSGRHLIEREINETTCLCAGYPNFHMRISQRKVPAALLKAVCRKEELELIQKKNEKIGQKEKKQIRLSAIERLMPNMPPSITGVQVLIDPKNKMLYLGTSSNKLAEYFIELFFDCIKFEPLRYDLEEIMLTHFKRKLESMDPVFFSTDSKDETASPSRDFLTWLWFYSESRKCAISHKQYGDFQLIIEPPFTLSHAGETDGVAETTVRKGNPTKSAEVLAAINVGKKLRKAKFVLYRDKEIWKFSFDADRFVFSGFSLPKSEGKDSQSELEERVNYLKIFFEVFEELFKTFVESFSPSNKKKTEKNIRTWLSK